MSWGAVAVAGAAVVGSVVSSSVASKSAKQAAGAQTYAADQQAQTAADTLALQKEMYDADVERNRPFYELGVEALPTMRSMVSGNYNMQESPAARYELQQGTRSLNRQLQARGLLGGGNAAMRLAELSSGIAAKDYNDQYNRLLDQIKVGTGASASMGQSSGNYNSAIGQYGQTVGNAQAQSGQARAALYAGQAGQLNNTINTGINTFGALNSLSNGYNNANSAYNSGSGQAAMTEAINTPVASWQPTV